MRRHTKPIFDRTALDIANKTAKAYFNVTDWLRIYNNAELMYNLVKIVETDVSFDSVSEPTMATDPQTYLTKLNTLLANIERVRDLISGYYPEIPDVTEIKDDWTAGVNVPSPTYIDVNQWEKVIDTIFTNIGEASGYADWIPDSGTPVRRARCSVGTCGAGLTRNNGFVKYN